MAANPDQIQFLKDQLKTRRVQADAIIQHLKKLPVKNAETTLAMRSMQMAKGHLGQLLGALLGPSTNPYPAAAHVKDIPPTSDVCTDSLNYRSHLEDINSFRDGIQSFIDEVKKLEDDMHVALQNDADTIGYVFSITHAQEAKMWLGHELSRLRDEYVASQTVANADKLATTNGTTGSKTNTLG